MGIYAKLNSVSPTNFKQGDKISANISIYNNEGSKYVTVEIINTLTNEVWHKFTTFTELGETNLNITFEVPDVYGNACLQAYANGKTLPDDLFSILEIYLNNEIVWKNGKQIGEAWIELEHWSDNKTTYNTVSAVVNAIPLYSNKVKVTASVYGCHGGTSYARDFIISEGKSTLNIGRVWACGDANKLISVISNLSDFTKYGQWVHNSLGNGVFIPKADTIKILSISVNTNNRFSVAFRGIYDLTAGRDATIIVKVNNKIAGTFYTSDSHEDVLINIDPLKFGNPPYIVDIYASAPIDDWILVFLNNVQIVKENPVYLNLIIKLITNISGYITKTVTLKCRGYYDNWFGGKKTS